MYLIILKSCVFFLLYWLQQFVGQNSKFRCKRVVTIYEINRLLTELCQTLNISVLFKVKLIRNEELYDILICTILLSRISDVDATKDIM